MQHELNIKRYLNALRRWWWLVVLLTLVTALATFLATPRSAPRYEATTTLVFEPQNDPTLRAPTSGGQNAAANTLMTRMTLIRSPQVLQRAATKVYPDAGAEKQVQEARALAGAVRALQVTGSDLVVITAHAPDPELAIRRANAVADATIEQTIEDQANSISRRLDLITRQLRALQQVRQESTIIDLQKLSNLEDELIGVAATLRSNQQQLDQLRSSEGRSQSDMESIKRLEARLTTAAASVELAGQQLQQIRDALTPSSNPEQTAAQIAASLEALPASLNRGAAQLDQVIERTARGTASSEPASLEGIANDLKTVENLLRRATSYLEKVPANAAPAVPGAVPMVQPAEIRSQVAALNQKLPALSSEVGGLTDGDEASKGQIIDELRGINASLQLVIRQIQILENLQTDAIAFGSLFLAEAEVNEGASIIDRAVSRLEGMTAGAVPSSAFVVAKERIIAIADELNNLAQEFRSPQALSLAGGQAQPRSDGQQQSLLTDEVLDLRASLQGIALQFQMRLTTETDPIVIGALLSSKERVEGAANTLTGIETQLAQLSGKAVSATEKQVAGFQSRLQGIASGIQKATDDLRAVRAELEKGQTVDVTAYSSVGTQVASAQAILQLVVTEAAAFRALETDLTVYNGVLGAEDQIHTASLNLTEASSEVTRIQSRNVSSQWLDSAVEQSAQAATLLDEVLDQLKQVGVNDSAPPDAALLAQFSGDLIAANKSLEMVSSQLARAQVDETSAGRFAQILMLDDRTRSSRTSLLDVARRIDELGQPPASEDSLYTGLIQSQRQLQLSRMLADTASVRVAEHAANASRVIENSLRTNTMLGVGAGLMLGLLAVLARALLDRRLRTQDDVRRYTGIPLLGAIPAARGISLANPLTDAPYSQFSQGVRLVRNNVDVAGEAKSMKVLLVTSPQAGEGKTTVALNLARSMAMEKKRVLLIDADLSKPDISSAFGLEGRNGLVTALRDGLDPAQFIVKVDDLYVLPAGEAMANPSDVVTLSTIRPFLMRARNEHDVVILDGPPLIGFADTLALAKSADAVLLALSASKTTHETARLSTQILGAAGAYIIGAVLNMADPKEFGPISREHYRVKAKPQGSNSRA
jgi:capsular exopolysaccharide synthesis family protein